MLSDHIHSDFIRNYNSPKLMFIIGPCAVESWDICNEIADKISALHDKYSEHSFFVFKASFKKANRSSKHSFTGINEHEALTILKKIRQTYKLPITTDVHETTDIPKVTSFADIIQIPAFLSRQTDLIQTAGATGHVVNIKKGQFLNADSMKFAVEKTENIKYAMITERGNSFGYQDLIVDMRNIKRMSEISPRVVIDSTHSNQKPNQNKGVTGGDPSMIQTITESAIVSGANGVFAETHPSPRDAKSDGANMLLLDNLEQLIDQSIGLYNYINTR